MRLRLHVESLDERITPSAPGGTYSTSVLTTSSVATIPPSQPPSPPPGQVVSNLDQLWILSDPSNPYYNGSPLSGRSVDSLLQTYGEIFTQVGNLDAVDLPAARSRWETAFAAFEAAVMANPNGDPTDLVIAANRAAYDYMKLGELQCELAARADAIINYLGFLDTLGYLTPGQSALLGVYETGPQLEQHPVDYRVITAPPDPNNPLAPGFEPPLVV